MVLALRVALPSPLSVVRAFHSSVAASLPYSPRVASVANLASHSPLIAVAASPFAASGLIVPAAGMAASAACQLIPISLIPSKTGPNPDPCRQKTGGCPIGHPTVSEPAQNFFPLNIWIHSPSGMSTRMRAIPCFNTRKTSKSSPRYHASFLLRQRGPGLDRQKGRIMPSPVRCASAEMCFR